MFLLYNVLVTLLAPLWAPWMWLRARARAEPPNWKERFGDYSLTPSKGRQRIWVHAVSVGEVVAALPLLSRLREEPFEVVLSVTTSSGHRTAREKAAGLFDHLVYFPIDVARFQLSAMQRVQPAVVAIMETELWMNFLWAAKVFDAQTLLVNGRISDRSYARTKWVRPLYATMLRMVDRCLMQSEGDAEKVKALGALSVEVVGNLKFDQALMQRAAGKDWRAELGLDVSDPSPPTPSPRYSSERGELVVVVGSTRGEDEERFVIEALAGLDGVQIVHAPRHLERVEPLVGSLKAAGFDVSLRSSGGGSRYVVIDTYGELDSIYSIADVVVVGGGFGEHGGQNLIQPLAAGKPVLHGPHMANFRDVADEAISIGASEVCSTPAELRVAVERLLGDESLRAQRGAAAKAIVERHAGAAERYAAAIIEEAAKAADRSRQSRPN